MNANDIFHGITDIRDDLIDGAEKIPGNRKRWLPKRWLGVVAAALAVVILGGIFLRPGGESTAYAIAQAEYPEMAPYPFLESDEYDEAAFDAWNDSVMNQRRNLGDTSSLQSFFARSAQTFLTGTEGENRVYSPLNVYMALSMLAQLTDGESQDQILTLLGSDSMDALRKQASDVWNANYWNDGSVTSILASSLWLNQDLKFNQDTMDTLAQNFYASSYQGKMGTESINKAFQDWLDKQTGGLLKEQAQDIKLDSSTVLALASTVYFQARWYSQFSEENTSPQIFHSPNGDLETEFMHDWGSADHYFWGDRFTALHQPFDNSGAMWFILPEDGMTSEELLTDPETVKFLFAKDKYSEWKNWTWLFVNKAIPKFDVCSQLDLREGLENLGITDVFDPVRSDFTPMTGNREEIALTKVDHAARVVIDEEGCTATAFTAMALAAGGPEDKEVDFVLDRPFLFCITGESGLPLFLGVVNNPVGN